MAVRGEPFIGSGRQWRGRETSGHWRRGVEINLICYKAEKRGGESTGWPVDEGKWRRREEARLHALWWAVRGHGTAAVRL
jgi:hypothetical protein